jgi:NTE family protein
MPTSDASTLTTTQPENPADRGFKPARIRNGISLSLSGGGFRATLFHLGALRRLNELGVLARLKTITSVSGGSIMAAHLATVIAKAGLPKPEDNDAWEERVVKPIVRLTSLNFRNRLLKRFLPWNWKTEIVELMSAEFEKALTDLKLSDLPEQPMFILCATDMAFGVNWVFQRERMGDYLAGYIKKGLDSFPLARAAAASACFPPFFNPLPIKGDPAAYAGGKFPKGQARSNCLADLRLTDGGVYDNMGLEPVWKSHETVLVSDAGGTFDYSGDRGLKWRFLRYTDVVQNQARALRKRWLLSSFDAVNPDGSRLLHGSYWSTSSARESYVESDTAGYSKKFAESAIARVRTDLDSFSEGETAVLENHGYLLADIAIQVHVPELYPAAPITLRIPHPELMNEEKAAAVLRKH